jgi:hypothetical protein
VTGELEVAVGEADAPPLELVQAVSAVSESAANAAPAMISRREAMETPLFGSCHRGDDRFNNGQAKTESDTSIETTMRLLRGGVN